MTLQAISKSHVTSLLLPVATALLATGIFVADAFTSREIAIGVLYVAVVLMAASFCGARGLALVTAGCVALTVVGFALSESGERPFTDIVNTIISIASIGLAAYFVLQRQSAEASLREKASLLDLTHDMIFVRGINDVITYWNHGAEQ